MNVISLSKKLSMAALAAAMVAAPAINVFAAPEDVIDTTNECSVTIHKYDMTAAQEDGIDLSKYTANGKQNIQAENDLADYVIQGVVFSYLRVGDIETVSEGGSIQVKYKVPDKLATILGIDLATDHLYTSNQLNKGLSTILTNNTGAKNALEDYLKEDINTKPMVETTASGVTKAEGLDIGLYLFVETKVPANVRTTVDPFFVSLPMTTVEGTEWFYDVDVYPKNQTNIPDLDKTVRQHDDAEANFNDKVNDTSYHDTATASEGDKVDYLIVSHLPAITSKATYLSKYTFSDEAAVGLTYNSDAEIYFYDNEADAKANNTNKSVATWEAGSRKFTATYNAYDANAKKPGSATFEITADGLEEINVGTDGLDSAGAPVKNYSNLWVVVSYSMTVDSNLNPTLGDTGNTNDVTLVWHRSNETYEDSLEDRARVFTYGIDLEKVFSRNTEASDTTTADPTNADPTKVSFSLRNTTDGHFVTAVQADADSGVYYVSDATKGEEESKGTVFKPNADGKLIINGLEADTYELVELSTDAGYNLLKEPVTITIKATSDEFTPSKTTLYDSKDVEANSNDEVIEINGDRASATVDGKNAQMNADNASTNAKVDMTITNTPGFKLPATGGAGTIAFTVAGCAVAFAGIAVITKKSKKKEQNA